MTDPANHQENERIARELTTAHLIDHYKRVHETILRKLGHARTATQGSMTGRDAAVDRDTAEKLRGLDDVWQDIIALFRGSGLTTAEMEQIGKVLEVIPATIRSHYETLTGGDAALMRLIAEMSAAEYVAAHRKAGEIAERLGVSTDFVLGDNDTPVPAQQAAGAAAETAKKAYIIMLDKIGRR